MKIKIIAINIMVFLFSISGSKIKIVHGDKIYIIDENRIVYKSDTKIKKMNHEMYNNITNSNINCKLGDSILINLNSKDIIKEEFKKMNSNVNTLEEKSEGLITTGDKIDINTIIFINDCWYYLNEFEKVNGYKNKLELENFINSLDSLAK